MKKTSTKWILGILSVAIGVIIAYFVPIPKELNRAGMVVLGSIVTANLFWIFNILSNYATGLLMLCSWVIAGAVDFPTAFNIFPTTTMWIIIGGLGLGAAATKTGLIKRIAYKIMSLFPANFSGQVLALMTAGAIISPMIPSAHPKNAMSAPIAKGLSDALGYKNKTKESSGIFLAAMWGFYVLEASFLSATAQNYAFKGLLPTKYQGVLSWGKWFLMMLPWTIIILIGGYLLINFLFKPKNDKTVSKDFIKKQLNDLGPMSRDEKLTAGVLIVTIIFWILESSLPTIPSAVSALVALSVLISAGVLDSNDIKTRISWNTVIFVGTVMSMGNVMQTVHLTNWLRDILKPVITPVTGNIWLAVIILPILLYLLKFVVVSLISTGTLVMLALLPFFSSMGFNPALLVLIITTSINIWLLSYMDPAFITGQAAVDDVMLTRSAAAKSSIGYMILNIIGLLLCVPVWQLMGLA